MSKTKTRGGIIAQVSALFALGVVLTGILTFFSQRAITNNYVTSQTERFAIEVAQEVSDAVKEYPTYEWLLRYWYNHADELSVEYDVDFGPGTRTEDKVRLLIERNPGFNPRYATVLDVHALSAADQRLYAEVTYSWLITRLNQIKQAHDIDFLFIVATDDYETQFFLLSAAEPGGERGTTYGQFYTLGSTSDVGEDQADAMRAARQERDGHLADAGMYVDYYRSLCTFDRHIVQVGLTYDLSDIRAEVMEQTFLETELAVALQVLLSLLCLGILYFLVLRPLGGVQHNIRLFKETKDSDVVIRNLAAIRPNNEIGQLSEDVSELAEEIDDFVLQIQTITMEKERIGTELALASNIQEGMLPSTFPAFPTNDEFDIYASMDPAREVGGDFYDFFLVDDDHLCMVIADVSGKGIPAALFMMASKIILANNAMMGKSPAQILTDTNNSICSNTRGEMFVTVWLGILELSTGRLVAANAGHEYPVLRRPDGQWELLRDKHGLVVGGMEGIRYREYELELEPGSGIFVYTDGLAEANDADERMFGCDRMLDALNEKPESSPEETIRRMRDAVSGFVRDAEQFDDLTMLCLTYRGK